MYITIVFLPFLAAILSGFFGRSLGVRGVHMINITCLLVTTFLSIIAFYEVIICNSPISVELFSWISIDNFKITWSFYFDELTVSMLIPVLIVSLLVHFYSVGYMGEDPHQQRFFSYISLFTGLMLVLISGDNFLVMFLGWEGVGVCSYLLVHFWYTRIAAVKSGMNAMFTNRVGDYFLTVGFFALFFAFGSLDYATVFSLAPYINTNVLTFISLLLLLGAAAKSAQLGLHSWLPQAMEGPTPVSALIHAATMVTAGVYLLIRCSPLLEQSQLALNIIMIAGAITAFFAASVGLFQNDIKKVIAYSTMSQMEKAQIYLMFRHQTICVKLITYISNSQITKARNYNYINNNFINSFYLLWQYFYKKSEKCKVIIISKLVGISVTMRLILITDPIPRFDIGNEKYPDFIRRRLNGFWDTLTHPEIEFVNIRPDKFSEWLSGIVDGKGHFIKNKLGRVRLRISMDIRDRKSLYIIKAKFGGSVCLSKKAKSVIYELRHDKGLLVLIACLNGRLRNPARKQEFSELCNRYKVKLREPKPLIYENAWFSGLLDSKGAIYYLENSEQICISIVHNNQLLLEPLVSLYGGKIDIIKENKSFKYVIFKRKELLSLIFNYFKKYPLRTQKKKRLYLIVPYYSRRITKTNLELDSNIWITFKTKWDKYGNW
jgi:NADH:ubiquinone oxidoreductase subunit 2 (subunit N)